MNRQTIDEIKNIIQKAMDEREKPLFETIQRLTDERDYWKRKYEELEVRIRGTLK